jgi:hypothetical protein
VFLVGNEPHTTLITYRTMTTPTHSRSINKVSYLHDPFPHLQKHVCAYNRKANIAAKAAMPAG